ncbi:MAG: hypothetical protein IJQ58_04645, partial [Synergistaceae bacterium]|nr:hypothetical protein [Synergistaceae bacterium]
HCTGTVVHYLYSGIVENCSFNGTIACDNTSSSFGAGGFVAHLEGGTVRNCTVTADISGASYTGGIAGEMTSGKIENCTTNVNLLSGTYKGGIVGFYEDDDQNATLSGNTWPSAYPQVGRGQNVGHEGNSNTLPLTSQDNTPTELEIAIISPVPDLSPDVIARLAQNISVDTSEIILLTSADFTTSDPPEPTQAMRQEVEGQNGKFIAKLNTINVSKDGWYVFMVTVSDDIVGTSISDLRLFGAEDSDFAASFKASFGFLSLFNGITGMYEVSNLFGLKLDTLEKQVLVTMLLSAGKSLTTYFVKILLMLLAGCNSAGIGIGAVFVIAGIIAVKFFRKKR